MKRPLLFPIKPQFYIILLLTSLLQLNNIAAYAQIPPNNECATAVTLTSGTGCTNTTGTVQNATTSGGIPIGTCTGSPNDDVWYRFTAVSADQTITLSNLGNDLLVSGARIQLFSGACGSLTSLACGVTVISVNNLVIGSIYYVRVYSAGLGALATGGFRICVTHDILDRGKSYVNLTKPNSGTVETGDVLEIRASVVVRAGIYDSCRFTDNIPVGTTFVPGTLRILTNEGKIFRQFTDAQADADQGWIIGTAITMNLGYNPADNPATRVRRGRIANNHKPSFFGGTCIMMATYRVTVTAAIGTQINTGGGVLTYSTTPPVVVSFTFPSNPVAIYTNFGMCANAIGTNSLGTEFNGTFGTGTIKDRGASANVPVGYTYAPFGGNNPNDYLYGVSNNTSTGGAGFSTVNTWAKPDNSSPTHRVFSVWDIIGDHTGAASPTAGNPPAAAGANGGYMLVVNAAYRIDSAFQQTISNLCPNTYYEISCWMRNICSKCGCDSNGVGASQAGYRATDPLSAPPDSSGVKPNITFEINGVDYYSTGNIAYTGQWVKRGFTILTGPTQTSFVLKFFNNAPGGGGNDWALDDISVATCLPNMRYSPSLTPNICNNNALTIYDTVRSYFNNYVYYKWQRSTNGGVSWTDVSTPFGPVPPGPNPNLHHNGTDWEYVSSYTIPPTHTFPGHSGDRYRLIVASTLSNLTDVNCRSTDVGNTITLNVLTCGPVLNVKIISFNARTENSKATLRWTTGGETEDVFFDIEKSFDGINFKIISTISNNKDFTSERDQYSFTDPEDITSKVSYRIRMRTPDNRSSYSTILQLLYKTEGFYFGNVINPFSSTLYFDIASARSGIVKAELVNQFGKPVRRKSIDIEDGMNQLSFENTSTLPIGIYILKVEMDGMTIYRKVMKRN